MPNGDQCVSSSLKSKKSINYNKNNLFQKSQNGIKVSKGDEMGRFNMGSTIVLVFEAGENFEPEVSVGERVLYGQKIGSHKSLV